MIEGIGKDAEIVVNEKGGKQSKAIGAFYLVDPIFLIGFFKEYNYEISNIAYYMLGKQTKEEMVKCIMDKYSNALMQIAKVLEYGASRYSPNNWRLIPEEDHLNHALIHLYALEEGDTQDDHLGHFLTRIMMAYATEKSFQGNYTEVLNSD